ncbi:MAG: ribbon-helix-helix protein, CopG family [Rudaea sp.]
MAHIRDEDTDMLQEDIRINARLTGEDAKHFIELQALEGGRSASDLLRDALREYYAAHAKPRPSAFAMMRSSGFIGGGDAPADLSSNYKKYLGESLDKKHRHRVNEPPSPPYNVKRKTR